MKPAIETERGAPWLVWLAVAALGWILCRQLALEWRINAQYSYGSVTPVLALYLIAERWKDRPEPADGLSVRWIFLGLLLLWLPVRLTQEANPDWRLTSWAAALIVVGIFWTGVAAVGGKAWWRHFAFASAFILLAVPWPTPVENMLVQALMQKVAAVAVEALNWIGVAAQQDGNLIRLAGGTLGVDEACSGVRSFQATIMVALFLAELNRLSLRRRVALVAMGVALALGLNLLRAVLLAGAAGRHGIEAVERWHDPAGYILLAVTFFGLLGLARLFGKSISTASPPTTRRVEWPVRGAVVVISWLIVCEIATAAWYGTHERAQVANAKWKVDWPYEQPNFARAKIAENIRLVLRFNEGDAAIWDRADGSRWHLFFFSWKPGGAAANLARNHRPESCLPATGFEFVANRGVKTHRVAGLELPIERIDFAKSGQRWHVYYCLWEDRTMASDEGVLSRENRVRAVLEGRRHLGQRVLEVVIAGLDAPERADEAFAEALPGWIKLEQ